MKKFCLIIPTYFLVAAQLVAQPTTPINPSAYSLRQSLRFEENKGQIAETDGKLRPDILYHLRDAGMNLFFTKKGLSYQWHYTKQLLDGPYSISEATGLPVQDEGSQPEKEPKPTRLHTYRVDMNWVGASDQVVVVAENAFADYNNYYLAHCPEGALNVKSYQKLIYKNIYPNVDVVYYLKDTLVKYDVVVHPGGDLSKVKYTYTSAVPQLIEGKVRIETPYGFLEEQPLAIFSEGKKIEGSYHKNKNEISFKVADFDPNQQLIIDPGLLWGTYYDGDFVRANQNGYFSPSQGVATDNTSGDVYLVGATQNSLYIASGGHQNTFGGGSYDAFLAKFNSAGVRQWGTYYGGTGNDYGLDIAVSSTGDIYLSGNTLSTSSIASGGHQNTFAGGIEGDGFLVKFNPAGVRQWGTYYGGTENDYGWDVEVSSTGDVYLSGNTLSTASIASGGHQNTFGGGNNTDGDAFLVKFNSAGVRQWGTYYGGASWDGANGLAVSSAGDVYLGGYTFSTSYIASDGHQATRGGNQDAFLVKFNSSGVRQWGTYYGGTSDDMCRGVVVSSAGDVYLAGATNSSTGISSSGHQNTYAGVGDAFLVKFNTNGVRQWGTYYGGNGNDYGYSVAVSSTGDVYLAGYTNSTASLASGGHQNTIGGLNDAFLVKFNGVGARQWGTYYGGTGNDFGYSIAVSSVGDVYLTGNTSSSTSIASGGHLNQYTFDDFTTASLFLSKFPTAGGEITNTEPTAQPSGFTIANLQPTSATISFAVASGNPDGYLVIRRTGAAPTGAPVDGTAYSINSDIGDGTVVFVGSALTFNQTSLTPSTEYFYSFFSYSGDNLNLRSVVNYRQSSPYTAGFTTVAPTPAGANLTNFTSSNVQLTSFSVSFSPHAGSVSYLALRVANGVPDTDPKNGVSYSIGAALGNATVAYVGTNTSFQETNLIPGTSYGYKIYAFNETGLTSSYRLPPLTGTVNTVAATPTNQPTDLVFNNISSSSMNVSYAAAAGNPTGYLVLRRAGAAPTGVPALGVVYSDVRYSVGNSLGDGEVAYVGPATTFTQTALNTGIQYFFSVFSYNGSAGATSYLTTNPLSGSAFTVPTVPVAINANLIASNAFQANWNASTGASSYKLDVTADNFVNLVTGYNAKVVTGTSVIVTGLQPNTTYQYRLKAVNASGESATFSNVISAFTAAPLVVSNVQAPASVAKNAAITVTATVSGGASSKVAKIFYRKILGSAFSEVAMSNTTGSTFSGSIPATGLDEIGSEFYVRAESSSEAIESAKTFVYVSTSAAEASSIPSIRKFGGTLESYQIISIPMQLEDNLISTIFEPPLGAYDKAKWRLVRFQNGRNTDYQAGLTRINQGESYWFNSITSVSVKPGAGTSPQNNQTKPFQLKLAQGWNQIATPYPFAIDWDDVLSANGNPAGVGKYRVYVSNPVGFAESNSLQPYSGGFVFTQQAIDLNIPVTLKGTAGGRKEQMEFTNNIGEESWTIPFTLVQLNAMNPLGAIGMRPDAKLGKDDFDDITLPRFVKYLELNSYHDEFFAPRFSKDIVPTAEEHRWNLTIESNFDEGDITLSWAGVDLGANDAQMILYDPVQGILLDMKKVKTHTIPNTNHHEVEILYSRKNAIAVEGAFVLGKPYPNPSIQEVSFNVFSWSPSHTKLEVYDMMGRKVFVDETDLIGKQLKTLTWGSQENSKTQSGVYIYKITSTNSERTNTIQGRIIIH